jgi:hypothetical protein
MLTLSARLKHGMHIVGAANATANGQRHETMHGGRSIRRSSLRGHVRSP